MTRARHFSALLEEFVGERSYVPDGAQVIDSSDDLPPRLQARARGARAETHWRAWTDGHRIWLILAQPVSVPSQQAGEIALKMGFYDQDGVLASCGIWLRRATGGWALYCVLDKEQAVPAEPAVAYGRLSLAS